jgi:hypothetical protein
MKFSFRYGFCIQLFLLSLSAGPGTLAQEQQFADLGDFRLESGAVIRGCRIGYRTFGKLADDKSNVIVFPTWASGTTEQAKSNIGPGKLFDSDKFFVVAVGRAWQRRFFFTFKQQSTAADELSQVLPERHGKHPTCAAREGPTPEPCKGCDG